MLRRAHSWLKTFRQKPIHLDLVGFSDRARKLLSRAARARFLDRRDGIDGWLSGNERRILYGLGRVMPGPIVEIGSWVGLSTTAIAQGIRDSGQMKPFYSYDLPLTTANFKPVNGAIGMFVDGGTEPMGTCSEECYRTDILPILLAPGGPVGQLRQNLKRFGLGDYVTIRTVDFKTAEPTPSRFIFCDIFHDANEIRANAAALLHFLKPQTILAVHDIGRKPELIEEFSGHIRPRAGTCVDSLYVCEI